MAAENLPPDQNSGERPARRQLRLLSGHPGHMERHARGAHPRDADHGHDAQGLAADPAVRDTSPTPDPNVNRSEPL